MSQKFIPTWCNSPDHAWRPSRREFLHVGAIGGLGLSLGGPRQYPDGTVSGPWLGDGRARATAGDVHTAVYLIAVATLLTAGILGAFALGQLSA